MHTESALELIVFPIVYKHFMDSQCITFDLKDFNYKYGSMLKAENYWYVFG